MPVSIALVEGLYPRLNVPCDLTLDFSIEMVTGPKEQRAEALDERVDTRSLGYRLNKLSHTINTSIPTSRQFKHSLRQYRRPRGTL